MSDNEINPVVPGVEVPDLDPAAVNAGQNPDPVVSMQQMKKLLEIQMQLMQLQIQNGNLNSNQG